MSATKLTVANLRSGVLSQAMSPGRRSAENLMPTSADLWPLREERGRYTDALDLAPSASSARPRSSSVETFRAQLRDRGGSVERPGNRSATGAFTLPAGPHFFPGASVQSPSAATPRQPQFKPAMPSPRPEGRYREMRSASQIPNARYVDEMVASARQSATTTRTSKTDGREFPQFEHSRAESIDHDNFRAGSATRDFDHRLTFEKGISKKNAAETSNADFGRIESDVAQNRLLQVEKIWSVELKRKNEELHGALESTRIANVLHEEAMSVVQALTVEVQHLKRINSEVIADREIQRLEIEELKRIVLELHEVMARESRDVSVSATSVAAMIKQAEADKREVIAESESNRKSLEDEVSEMQLKVTEHVGTIGELTNGIASAERELQSFRKLATEEIELLKSEKNEAEVSAALALTRASDEQRRADVALSIANESKALIKELRDELTQTKRTVYTILASKTTELGNSGDAALLMSSLETVDGSNDPAETIPFVNTKSISKESIEIKERVHANMMIAIADTKSAFVEMPVAVDGPPRNAYEACDFGGEAQESLHSKLPASKGSFLSASAHIPDVRRVSKLVQSETKGNEIEHIVLEVWESLREGSGRDRRAVLEQLEKLDSSKSGFLDEVLFSQALQAAGTASLTQEVVKALMRITDPQNAPQGKIKYDRFVQALSKPKVDLSTWIEAQQVAKAGGPPDWGCSICAKRNNPQSATCGACGRPRGKFVSNYIDGVNSSGSKFDPKIGYVQTDFKESDAKKPSRFRTFGKKNVDGPSSVHSPAISKPVGPFLGISQKAKSTAVASSAYSDPSTLQSSADEVSFAAPPTPIIEAALSIIHEDQSINSGISNTCRELDCEQNGGPKSIVSMFDTLDGVVTSAEVVEVS
jgi:hypothetical protein